MLLQVRFVDDYNRGSFIDEWILDKYDRDLIIKIKKLQYACNTSNRISIIRYYTPDSCS